MSAHDRKPSGASARILKPDRARPSDASRSTTKGDVPIALLDRYLIERDRQGRPERFFRDHRASDPAFRDQGRRLETRHPYPDTITDMLKIAEHRGWTRLRVEGDEAFRRDVWIQARARGLEVASYRPRDRDRQAAGETPEQRRQDRNARIYRAAAVVRALIPDPAAQARVLEAALARLRGREERRSRPERER